MSGVRITLEFFEDDVPAGMAVVETTKGGPVVKRADGMLWPKSTRLLLQAVEVLTKHKDTFHGTCPRTQRA